MNCTHATTPTSAELQHSFTKSKVGIECEGLSATPPVSPDNLMHLTYTNTLKTAVTQG